MTGRPLHRDQPATSSADWCDFLWEITHCVRCNGSCTCDECETVEIGQSPTSLNLLNVGCTLNSIDGVSVDS